MELQKIISQEISNLSVGLAATVQSGPLSGDEKKFVEALSSPLIKNCSDEQIKQVLRYVMIKVGLRANNFPDDIEKAVLLGHLRQHYGLHHLEELRIAFDMAVVGSLDIETDKVICYENFSCTYVSLIMKAYRAWSSEAYESLIKDQPINQSNLLMAPTDWRGYIQTLYENTPPDDKLRYKMFAPQMYDQVVNDGFLHPEIYRDYMRYAKKELCAELQQQLTPLIAASYPEDQTKIDSLQQLLNDYRASKREQAIITRAKQICVWVLFQEARRRKMPAMYQRVDEQKSRQLHAS